MSQSVVKIVKFIYNLHLRGHATTEYQHKLSPQASSTAAYFELNNQTRSAACRRIHWKQSESPIDTVK